VVGGVSIFKKTHKTLILRNKKRIRTTKQRETGPGLEKRYQTVRLKRNHQPKKKRLRPRTIRHTKADRTCTRGLLRPGIKGAKFYSSRGRHEHKKERTNFVAGERDIQVYRVRGNFFG